MKWLLFCAGLLLTATLKSQDLSAKEYEDSLVTAKGTIYGTLTVTNNRNKTPVALLIAGSGPTDRNGNNPAAKNASLQKIAEALAAKGIASLRYDKRGIAKSAGAGIREADLRFEDYINDAKGWVEKLKKDPRFSNVIIIGHSEGSLIGMNAAEKADQFISIAGAGRPADIILREQLAAQPSYIRDTCYIILDQLKAGKTVSNVNPMLASLFRPSVQPYLISWFAYDPALNISKLNIPCLIIQGTNDIQVSVEDAKLLAAAKPAAQLLLVEKMNHILRIVEGDRQANMKTYNDPGLPISTEMMAAIISFIQGEKK